MTTLKERQRAAARARLEREMAARAETAAQRRKRRNTALASAGAVIAVVAVVVILVNAFSGKGPKSTPGLVTAVATNPPAECGWVENPALKGTGGSKKDPDLIDTGLPPSKTAPRNGSRAMTLNTSQGTIVVTLDLANAPCSAASMDFLASKHFYDNTKCHRLTTDGLYILQCGDPSGKGDGGPAYTYAHENLPTDQQPNYPAGVVAIANPNNPDANGSQFFIVYQDTPGQINPSTGQFQSTLASNYTIIGTVTSGMDVIQRVAAAGVQPSPSASAGAPAPADGAPKLPITINTLTVGPVTN